MMHPYPSQKSQRSRQMQFLGHLVLSHACHGSGSMFESRHGVSRPLRHRDRWRFLRALGIPVVFSGSTGDVALSPTHSWICLLPIKSKKKKREKKKTWKRTRHGFSGKNIGAHRVASRGQATMWAKQHAHKHQTKRAAKSSGDL